MLVITPFTHQLVQHVYRLEGAEWISQKGVWQMPMTHYSALLKALPAVPGVRLDVQPLPVVAQALVKVWLCLSHYQQAALAQVYVTGKVIVCTSHALLSQVANATKFMLST